MNDSRRSFHFWSWFVLYGGVMAGLGFFLGRGSAPEDADASTQSRSARTLAAKNADTRTSPPGNTARRGSPARVTDSEADEVLQAAQPGVPNPVLRQKLWAALFETDENIRMSRFQSLLTLMRPEDAAAMEQVFYDADKDGRSYGKEWHAFFAAWGKVDGRAVMERLQTSNHLLPFSSLAEGAARSWARESPEAALRWLEEESKVPGLRHAGDLTEGVWKGILQHDPAGAADLVIKSFPAPEATRRLAGVAWAVIHDAGLDAGRDWLAQQSARTDLDPALLRNAVQAVAQASARGGAERLAEFVASRPDDDELKKEIPELVNRWWPANNIARLDFMESMPGSYDPPAVAVGLSAFDSDPDALGQWLKNNSRTRFYDEAVQVYVRSLQSLDPGAAKQWAETIRSQSTRSKVLESLHASPSQ